VNSNIIIDNDRFPHPTPSYITNSSSKDTIKETSSELGF
jgi:hypothetical protein